LDKEFDGEIAHFERLKVLDAGRPEALKHIQAEEDALTASHNAATFGAYNKNLEEFTRLWGEMDRISAEGAKKQEAADDAKTKKIVDNIGKEAAALAALVSGEGNRRIEQLDKEMRALEQAREFVIRTGGDTAAIDAKLHQDALQRQKDLDAQMMASGKLAEMWRSTLDEMAQDGQQWQAQTLGVFRHTVDQMNTDLASFIVTGQANWRQLAASAIEEIIKIGLQWVESKLLMLALGKVAGVGEITTQAAIAGAGGTASMAAAPFPLDLGAPAFGAAMMGTALSYLGMLSAAGGAVLPSREMLVHTHPNEMILPQHISNFIVNAASSASGGGSTMGGPYFNSNISVLDAAGLDRVLEQHREVLIKHLNAIARTRHY
jgi:lambda family phage tail tape measure protein